DRDVDRALQDAVPASQRRRPEADDRQAVEVLDAGPEADEALDVGNDFDVDRGAVEAREDRSEARQALERQGEQDLIDAAGGDDVPDLVPAPDDGRRTEKGAHLLGVI